MKKYINNEIEYAIRTFLNIISKDSKDTYVDTITRKIFFKRIEETKHNLNMVVEDFTYSLENDFITFIDEISNEVVKEHSDTLWIKFEDGHDICEGEIMICYFIEEKKYRIGELVYVSEEIGSSFKFEDGSVKDPDYVCPFFYFNGVVNEN